MHVRDCPPLGATRWPHRQPNASQRFTVRIAILIFNSIAVIAKETLMEVGIRNTVLVDLLSARIVSEVDGLRFLRDSRCRAHPLFHAIRHAVLHAVLHAAFRVPLLLNWASKSSCRMKSGSASPAVSASRSVVTNVRFERYLTMRERSMPIDFERHPRCCVFF